MMTEGARGAPVLLIPCRAAGGWGDIGFSHVWRERWCWDGNCREERCGVPGRHGTSAICKGTSPSMSLVPVLCRFLPRCTQFGS